jgi:hypothetical protein
LLLRETKFLVKVLGTRPFAITADVIVHINRMRLVDYAHIALLIAESRMELTINYAVQSFRELAFPS